MKDDGLASAVRPSPEIVGSSPGTGAGGRRGMIAARPAPPARGFRAQEPQPIGQRRPAIPSPDVHEPVTTLRWPRLTLYSSAMSPICRREALLAMALLAPGGRALYALQSSQAKPATVTLIISGMT